MSQSFLRPQGQAPLDATYVTQTANANLTNEQALSLLSTGYVKVSTGTGVLTSQAVPIPTTDGGTGATSFTTNGVIYKAASALASTAAGTTGQLFKAVTGSAPIWGQVILTTDVTGILPIANGGTNNSVATTNGAAYYDGTKVNYTSAGTTSQVLHANTGSAPTWSAVSLTVDVTGVLPIANGGTNNSAVYTAGSIIFSNGTLLTEDNANFFWNNTAKEQYLGAATAGSADIILRADGSAVFNEQGSATAADFRIEGDTATNLFVVDYSANSVEIGTTTQGALAKFNATEIVFNENAGNIDFRVEGAADNNLFFVDASANQVGVKTNAPHSTLDIRGGISLAIRTETTNYVVTADDYAILGNPGAGVDITVTLPDASTIGAGAEYVIKKINVAVTDTVTITPAAGDTIDGGGAIALTVQWSGRTLISDGVTNWLLMSVV